MNNYIPTDKLIAEITRIYNEHHCRSTERYEDGIDDGYHDCCDEIVAVITSLQQEPRFPQYNNIVEKVFGAGNLEGFEYREAEMLVALAKEELLKSLQQEQPEVDLEKEMNKLISLEYVNQPDDEWEMCIARHFYEFGLNARK